MTFTALRLCSTDIMSNDLKLVIKNRTNFNWNLLYYKISMPVGKLDTLVNVL